MTPREHEPPVPAAATPDAPRRALLRRLIVINLAAVIPVAVLHKHEPGLLIDALMWVVSTGVTVQFWGGIAAAVFLAGWRRFGVVAALCVLPVVLIATMITGFHV